MKIYKTLDITFANSINFTTLLVSNLNFSQILLLIKNN